MQGETLRDCKEKAISYIYNNFEDLFPDMEAKEKRNKKKSPFHIDGSRSSDGEGCTIYPSGMINDFSQGTKPLLDFYLEKNKKTFSFETMLEVYRDFGISIPESYTQKDLEEWEKIQNLRKWAQVQMEEALLGDSQEAKSIRDYLKGRGWTEEEIRKAKLGYISSQFRKNLQTSAKTKLIADEVPSPLLDGYILSIPHTSGNSLEGWNFRTLQANPPKGKYLHTKGEGSKNSLQGVKRTGTDTLIIVEGDLDALHAQVKGALNVAATMGGEVRPPQVEDALKKGYKNFILLFDNDERGQSFIDKSISNIEGNGGRVFVSVLPDGVKDTDEYLSTRSASEWKSEVEKNALPSCLRKLWAGMSLFPKGEITLLERTKIMDFFRSLIKSTPLEDRELLRGNISKYAEDLLLGSQDLEEIFLQAETTLNEKNKSTILKEVSQELKEALDNGRTFEAEVLLKRRAEELSSLRDSARYIRDFAPFSSAKEIERELSSIEDGIPTGIVFSGLTSKNHFTIKEGLSFVCGSQGHRKTTFLLNIALNEAERNIKEYSYNGGEEPLKKVLFFTYEMDRRRIIQSLINIYLDGDLGLSPFDTLESYFKKKGNIHYKDREGAKKDLSREVSLFLNKFILSGAITIVYADYKVGSLIQALRYFRAKNKVSLTLIDYAQQIYSENPSRLRTEEVKEVVNRIKDYAITTSLPVLMGAQFNREVKTPLDVHTDKIGEAGDFERIGVDIIGLYYLRKWDKSTDKDKVEKLYGWKNAEGEIAKKLSSQTLEGCLYLKLIKSRFGDYPLDLILSINDRSGRIYVNEPLKIEVEEPKQGTLFPEPPPATITGGNFGDYSEKLPY